MKRTSSIASIACLALLLLADVAISSAYEADQSNGWCFFYNIDGCKCSEIIGLNLDCANRSWTSVPDLIEDSSWIAVDFSHNRILTLTKYQFANVHIKKLDLSHNQLEAIHDAAFGMSDNIQTLLLNDNRITKLPNLMFAKLPSLNYLDISGNPLDALNFNSILPHTKLLDTLLISRIPNSHFFDEMSKISAPSHIKHLTLMQNGFTGISPNMLKNLPLLETIDLSGNRISDLDPDTFKHNSNLTLINLESNAIEKLPTLSSASVRVLNLGSNSIAELGMESFLNLLSIRSLNFSRNRISFVDRDAFCGLSSTIEKIDFGHNQLSTLSSCVINATNASAIVNLENNSIVCNCSIPPLAESETWSILLTNCKDNNLTRSVQNYLKNNTCETEQCTKACDQARKKPASIFQTEWRVEARGPQSSSSTHLKTIIPIISIIVLFTLVDFWLLP